MSIDSDRLLQLLPALYRLRDESESNGQRGALRALLAVIASQLAAVEEDIAQLYDDQFIETCEPWVAPYIGDLIGYRTLYGVGAEGTSPRAEVANTLAYRRRKGTASMLEQLARDVTGWDARVVEFFQLLATTQYLNHIRPHNVSWVNLRKGGSLATIGTPFESAAHTADVRRIARQRGFHNIPNIGLYLWRIGNHEVAGSPATKLVPADPSDRRYLFSPIGANTQLYSNAVAEDTISHLAERTNVPAPITRRELFEQVEAFYPDSIALSAGGTSVPVTAVMACDLSDFGGGWAYTPTDKILIDPELGRLSLPATLAVGANTIATSDPIVTFHYGFPGDLGGGDYERAARFSAAQPISVMPPAKIAPALAALGGAGLVELTGNGRFTETLAISAAAGQTVELRGSDHARPVVELTAELVIDIAEDATVAIDGLLLTGAAIRLASSGARGRLILNNCTLVPGIALNLDGTPQNSGKASLTVEAGKATVIINRSIVGAIRAHEDSTVCMFESIVDATGLTEVAYAAPDAIGAGGELRVMASTLIGKVHTRILRLASNSILAGRLTDTDSWKHPIWAERHQEGCARFSYVPPGSRTPRAYQCQPRSPADAVRVQPQFTSMRYGEAAYCQLSGTCAPEIRTGADDESEMGAYHFVHAPQRETNLQVRLEEYLRFGLEAGIIDAT